MLFVGTKRQAKDIVREAATATGMPFCVDRWLGGTLTNYETVKRSIAKFKKYQQMETSGEMSKLPRKEESAIKREMARMQRNFNGIARDGRPARGAFRRRREPREDRRRRGGPLRHPLHRAGRHQFRSDGS